MLAVATASPAVAHADARPAAKARTPVSVLEPVPVPYLGHLSAAQVVGDNPSKSAVTGAVATQFDLGFTKMDLFLRPENTGGNPVVSVSLRCGSPGAVGAELVDLLTTPIPDTCDVYGDEISCTITNKHIAGVDCVPAIGRPITNMVSVDHAMRLGLVYLQVGTSGGGMVASIDCLWMKASYHCDRPGRPLRQLWSFSLWSR